MTKGEYLDELRAELSAADISNIDGRIEYYGEMIDDRIEDGMTEEDAVASMEPIESIVETSKLEKPVTTLVREKVKESHERAVNSGHALLWIVLLIIGFPLWFPILLALGIVLVTLYGVFWILIASFYIVEVSLGVAAIGCFAAPFLAISAGVTAGTIVGSIGAGLVLAGVSILLWKPLFALCKGAINCLSALIRWLKGVIFK